MYLCNLHRLHTYLYVAYLPTIYVLYLIFIIFLHAHLWRGIDGYMRFRLYILHKYYLYSILLNCSYLYRIYFVMYLSLHVCCCIAVTFKIFISNISFMAINSQCHIREYINGCRCCILINNP